MEIKEGSFTFVDRKSSDIVDALAVAPIYKKQGQLKARHASPGEKITTTLSGGIEETTNTAKTGDWVVTNPGGEQYILSETRFLNRYEPTDIEGVYEAKGYIRAIPNPFGKPIEIMASWGSPQTGDERCRIADTCNENGECEGEPYIIEAKAFEETYKQI